MSSTPPSDPDVTPCPYCIEGGRRDPASHSSFNCPSWVSVDTIPTADLKGMLAGDGLSLDVKA